MEEFTEEELSQLEGRDIEAEEPAVQSEESPMTFEEKPSVSEVRVEEEVEEEDELAKMKRANSGLINELRSLREKSRADREWRQAVEQRMELLTEKLHGTGEQQIEDDPEPDRDEDPVAWLAWDQRRAIQENLQPIYEKEEREAAQQELQEAMREVAKVAREAEREFIETSGIPVDEYNTALDELRFHRMNWYVASGMDPDEARSVVEGEERNFVVWSLHEGKNPAAEIMRMHAAVKPGHIPGREPKVEEEPKPVQSSMQKVSVSKQGTQENRNLPGSSGKSGRVTFEQFAEMDQSDPLFQRIANNESLFAQLNIYGEVEVPL